MERSTLQFFLDQANPHSGLVHDAAENFGPTAVDNDIASIASTGFGLAVIANAAQRGMLDRQFAKNYVLKTVLFCRDHVARYKGWFLHWVNWETGAREWDSEYSTIDTALFMAGALYAAQVFQDPQLTKVVDRLYAEIDFLDMMTDGGTKPNKRTLSLSYTEGEGYNYWQWSSYAEHMILLVLGLGHPTHPLPPETWLAWDRRQVSVGSNHVVMGLDAPLFIHQYSELFLDLRHFNDGYPNYFESDAAVTEVQRDLRQHDSPYASLRQGFWGFSAGLAPDQKYLVYNAVAHTGLVCIGCAIGSAMFEPQTILTDAVRWFDGPYRNQIWGKYGFTDSLDLDHGSNGWFAQKVLGVTVGPEFLSLANMDESTSVWKTFMSIPAIQRGLAVAAGAQKTAAATTNVELVSQEQPAQEAPAPNPLPVRQQ